MSKAINPTLILSAADSNGASLDTPLFCALNVTHGLVLRLRRLARLCKTHRIAWLATQDVEPPVYWDASDEVMTEQTTTWFAVGASIYVELSARRRVRGGYGRLEVIGQSPVFDLAELVHMRQQRIVLDFREHHGQNGRDGEPFALAVIQRLRGVGVWPPAPHRGDAPSGERS